MTNDKVHGTFSDLLRRLVRVPKHEIDEQEQKYRDEREESTEKRLPVIRHTQPRPR